MLNLIKFFIRLNPQMSPWGAFPWFNETPGFNEIRLRQNQLRLIFQTIKTQVLKFITYLEYTIPDSYFENLNNRI